MIHQIRIQNFKSLRDVTVDLSPVTVFVGKSGTGKTNFASAIRFLRDYLGGRASGSLPSSIRTASVPRILPGRLEFRSRVQCSRIHGTIHLYDSA